jgi:hypothetical protein
MSPMGPAQRDRLTSPLRSNTAPCSFNGSMNDARLLTPAPGPKPRTAVAAFVAGVGTTVADGSSLSSKGGSTEPGLLVGGRLGVLDMRSWLELKVLLSARLATGLCCTGELRGDEGVGVWSS